jgi:hypothetical protein
MRLRRVAAYVAYTSVFLYATSAVRAQTVTLQYSDTRLYIPVTVPNAGEQWFILDTGASGTVVDAGLAARMGLHTSDTTRTTGVGRNTVAQSIAPRTHFVVGSASLDVEHPVVMPIDSLLRPYTGRAAPGIIGAQLFREHVVDIDFDSKTVTLHDPATYRYKGPGTVVPITFMGDLPVVKAQLIMWKDQLVPLTLVVDLGAKATLLLTEQFAARTHMLDSISPTVSSVLGAGVGGETRYRFARLRALSMTRGARDVNTTDFIAGFSQDNTLRSDAYDGLLGAGFLEGYRVIFDYSRGSIIFEARKTLPSREFDMSGIYWMDAGTGATHRYVIHSMNGGSAASRAGLRTGDALVSANGIDASHWTLSDLRDLLRSRAGTTIPLVVDRKGKRVSVTLRLARIL